MKRMISLFSLLLSGLLSAGAVMPTITQEAFGQLSDTTKVELYTLTNRHGLEAKIMTYGGIVVSLKVPDRDGKLGDVVLGYDNLDGYVKNNPYFGAIIGRYGNRIGKGAFSLNGKQYQLAKNNKGIHHLHGGTIGFDKVVWQATTVKQGKNVALALSYLSKDGEEGYPGNLKVTVVYTLTDNDELKIDYSATSDQDTVVNLTHHSYFNLAGGGSILDHVLSINASHMTPVDKGLIPTGVMKRVDGTPFDFRAPTAIGARIAQKDEQLKFGIGYDHNWVLDRRDAALAVFATLDEPKSGRSMEVSTTEPGIQFYSGNFLDGTIKGKGGQVYQQRFGLCLETQHFPDSPNQRGFPPTALKAGEAYSSSTAYRFFVKK